MNTNDRAIEKLVRENRTIRENNEQLRRVVDAVCREAGFDRYYFSIGTIDLLRKAGFEHHIYPFLEFSRG